MPIVHVGRYRQWAPTADQVLEVLDGQANPVSVRQLRTLLWEYEKRHIQQLGEVLYINYPAIRAILDNLTESQEIKKIKQRRGWPKYAKA